MQRHILEQLKIIWKVCVLSNTYKHLPRGTTKVSGYLAFGDKYQPGTSRLRRKLLYSSPSLSFLSSRTVILYVSWGFAILDINSPSRRCPRADRKLVQWGRRCPCRGWWCSQCRRASYGALWCWTWCPGTVHRSRCRISRSCRTDIMEGVVSFETYKIKYDKACATETERWEIRFQHRKCNIKGFGPVSARAKLKRANTFRCCAI